MKLRSTREVYWVAACASAAMVMENTTPATVIIEPAMVASTSRAPSASSVNSHGRRSAGAVPSARSSATSASASAIAAETIIAGRNQKLERRLIASRLTVPLEMRLPIPPPVRRPKVAMSRSKPCEAAPHAGCMQQPTARARCPARTSAGRALSAEAPGPRYSPVGHVSGGPAAGCCAPSGVTAVVRSNHTYASNCSSSETPA